MERLVSLTPNSKILNCQIDPKMLELHSSATQCAHSAILISGSARSGTTIVGKLIHSFEGVEYVFEPPALIALFSIIEHMPEAQWKFLYEAYLYEEFLINAVSGRAINTNVADDSAIYAVKGASDIERRLNRSWPKMEAARLAAQSRVAYKIPNIIPFIPLLRKRYPGTKVVMVKRGASETISSLMAKHVFTPDHPSSMLPWPTRVQEGKRYPYWLKLGDEGLWDELNELDRCAYYYICMNDGVDEFGNQLTLKYATLINNPRGVAEALANELGMNFGERTDEIIDSIKPTGKRIEADLLGAVSTEFRREVLEYSARSE
jgi:hypothetical protein